MKTLLISLFLLGCGPLEPSGGRGRPVTTGNWEVDPQLVVYIGRFLDRVEHDKIPAANLRVIKSIRCVDFIWQHPDYVGLTVFTSDGAEIVVECDGGSRYTEAVVYHELGHGLYDLDHDPRDNMLMSAILPDANLLSIDAIWNMQVSHFMTFLKTQLEEREANGPGIEF